MRILALLVQIGELFEGRFSWRGVLHLSLFIVMALIALGFFGFVAYKAFYEKKK